MPRLATERRQTSAERLGRILPNALAFVASFAVMVVELVGGRLLAAYVGASLYTWTSVIGVVLGGISVGNFVGGRLADRYETRPLLSGLFLLGAIACLTVPIVNVQVGNAGFVSGVSSWPLRIALHVVLVFLVPSATLGTIGPVVAKMAVDTGTSTGRLVGGVYAWGAVGSIAGTFTTGFYLIATFGTGGIVFTVAGLLGLVGFLLWPRFAWPLVGMLGLGVWLTLRTDLFEVTWRGRWPAVRERCVKCLNATESQYAYVRVEADASEPVRRLVLDNLIHAYYLPGAITDLRYPYEKIYAAATQRFLSSRQIHALFIGGGGYIFPRYLRARWPRATTHVAEIDPAVTDAVLADFGMRPDEIRTHRSLADLGGDLTPDPAAIDVFHLDARNHVEDLIRARGSTGFQPFDVVYGDAFTDFAVPFHLVTRVFVQKIHDLLRPDTGLYMINVIDLSQSGRFLGAIYQTMRGVFPYVAIFTAHEGAVDDEDRRETFVLIGALRRLDLEALGSRTGEQAVEGRELSERERNKAVERAGGMVLTDDYAPVENLHAPVGRHNR